MRLKKILKTFNFPQLVDQSRIYQIHRTSTNIKAHCASGFSDSGVEKKKL